MIFQGIINLLELLATIAGTLYIAKYRDDNITRYFVYFLWLTVFVEFVFGWLPTLIYYMNTFSFLKGTFLEKNYWVYNIYFIISFYVYINYFKWNIKSIFFKKILTVLSAFYLISSFLNLIFSNFYFSSYSSYTFILGTVLFLFSIALFYFEMLKSDEVLNFHKSIPFYISIASLLFHVSVTPLSIYSKYFRMSKSPDFVEIYEIIFNSANIFMYTCYTFGFLICLKRNKFYS